MFSKTYKLWRTQILRFLVYLRKQTQILLNSIIKKLILLVDICFNLIRKQIEFCSIFSLSEFVRTVISPKLPLHKICENTGQWKSVFLLLPYFIVCWQSFSLSLWKLRLAFPINFLEMRIVWDCTEDIVLLKALTQHKT